MKLFIQVVICGWTLFMCLLAVHEINKTDHEQWVGFLASVGAGWIVGKAAEFLLELAEENL